jgi:hypothetical protein
METTTPSVTFEASGLPCVILMTVPGAWLACVEISKGHALYRCRREVEIAVPDAFGGRAVDRERVAWADMPNHPTVLEAGASLPASLLLACPGGIMYTGVPFGLSPKGKWWIGFHMPGDTSQDEVRAELEPFAVLVAALAHVPLMGGPPPYREIA